VSVTPGRLTSLWHILRCLDKLGGRVERGELLDYASRSSLRSGGLPVVDGLRLAREGRFVSESAGTVDIAPFGQHALRLEDEDEPGAEVRRLFVSVLLLRDPPTWVAIWQGDPTMLHLVLSDKERQVLRDCNLLPEPEKHDLAGWAWWQALTRVPLPEETAAQRRLIGDAGEQLTIAHEQRRLESEGFPRLAARVAWVAQESAAYGFDVLSFTGRSGPGDDPSRPIAIEVKATTLPTAGEFPLFLSSHEWETAQRLGDRYLLHLWPAVNPGPPARSPVDVPHMRPATTLSAHLPAAPSCGDRCSWQTAAVRLPLDDAEDARD